MSPLPPVTLSVASLLSGSPGQVTLITLPRVQAYITSVYWVTSSTLSVTLSTRNQTYHSVLLCSAPDFTCNQVSTQLSLCHHQEYSQVFADSDTFGVWEGSGHLVFGGEEDNMEMIVRTAIRDGENGFFKVGE